MRNTLEGEDLSLFLQLKQVQMPESRAYEVLARGLVAQDALLLPTQEYPKLLASLFPPFFLLV